MKLLLVMKMTNPN